MSRSAYFSSVSFNSALLAALGLALLEGRAQALQPLEEFLAGARRASVDEREAALAAVLRQHDALTALGRALPALGVRGVYTRNQFSAEFPFSPGPGLPTETLVIQPLNQLDGFFQLDVPIIDVAAWARVRSARESARAGRHTAEATSLEVQKQVARLYYQLAGAEALRLSAERTLAAAQDNFELTRVRRASGVATELDVERARAEVERGRQNIADAELLASLSRRSLHTLTGLEAQGGATVPSDDLHVEAPLSSWEATPGRELPALAAAEAERVAALAAARASTYALLPTLSATALERVTNASGFFAGHDSFFTLMVTLGWRLDLTTLGTRRAQHTQAELAAVREERTRLAVHDQIFEAWERVRAGIAKSRAARAQTAAASLAARAAVERYESGAGTQLDVVQAQRDAYAAEVARIQADADLAFARALLRLAAGRPLARGEAR